MNLPKCPECSSELTYHDGERFVCPDCAHEWAEEEAGVEHEAVVKDAHGNVLQNGDSIILIKDLKLKGGGGTLKKGAKAKNIRLVDGDHEIDCRVDDMKVMLKAEYVKKA